MRHIKWQWFLSILLILQLLSASAAAQTAEFPSGLLFDDAAYEKTPRQSMESGAKSSLPPAVDLSPYCPEVRHQGYIFSCVGWATGYGAMTIQRAILNSCTDKSVISQNAFSALFLYNQIKTSDCRQGSKITDALSFLEENGDCLAKHFDFDVNNCETRPDPPLVQNARRYAIEDYVTLFGSRDPAALKVAQVKKALAYKKPVIAGLSLLRNFYDLKNAKFWHPNIGNTAPAGGHALVVVGYDDRREAFRLFNSWGKEWGDEGYIWIKYADFGQFCKYGFILHLVAQETQPNIAKTPATLPEMPLTELSGEFSFRQFTGFSQYDNRPVFENAPMRLANGIYQTTQTSWQIGQRFQLLARTLRAEEYLYVFSIDPNRQVHFHWPRQEGLDTKFSGINESGLLIDQSAEVIIPGPNRVLKMENPGTERLVVLFSKKKIHAVEKLAQIISRSQGDFMSSLRYALGKYAVPEADIFYHREKMFFQASSRSGGYIVPLVLEVTGN